MINKKLWKQEIAKLTLTQKELIRLQELNLDLLDANNNLVSHLVDLYEKHELSHEEFSNAKMLHKQASKALARLNERNQPKIYSQDDQPQNGQNRD